MGTNIETKGIQISRLPKFNDPSGVEVSGSKSGVTGKINLDLLATKTDVNNIDNNRKGYFSTDAELKAEYPKPKTGWYAYVGSTGTIWKASGSSWVDTGEPIPDDVDFSLYATKAELGKEIQHVNPYMVEGIQLYKPSTTQDVYVDISKVFKYVRLTITAPFRKPNGSIRRIKVRSMHYTVATSTALMALDIENENGTFVGTSANTTTNNILQFNLSFGSIRIELNTDKMNTVLANTVATFEQGGLNPDFVEKAVIHYERGIQLNKVEFDIIGINDMLDGFFNPVELLLSNKYIDLTGSLVSSTNWRVTQYIPVKPGMSVKYTGDTQPSGTAGKSLYGYDADKKPVTLILNTGTYTDAIVTIPDGVFYIVGCSHNSTAMNISIMINAETLVNDEQIQEFVKTQNHALYKSDGSIADFLQYANIALTFYTDKYWNASTGVLSNLSGWASTDKIKVNEGDIINTKGWLNGANKGYVLIWNTAGSYSTFIRPRVSTPTDIVSITVEAGWGYVAFNLGDATTASINAMISSFKAALNGTPTDKPVVDWLIPVANVIGGVNPSNRKKINKSVRFVGHSIWWQDSRVYNGTTDIARGNQTLLREQFDFLSDSGTSYCYSGHSLGGTSTSDTACIMNKAGTWVGTQGDIWTLDSITNDFKRDIPIGTINDYTNATGITTYYGALRAYRDKVIELSGATATVICSNALRRDNGGYNTNTINPAGHGLLDYEKAIMTVAKLNKWYFVDQFRLSGITDNSLSSTTLDGLHPNDFGYTLCVLPWITTFDIIYNKLLIS